MPDGRFVKLPVDILAARTLTPAAKLVYAAIADRIGENGECWPGQRRIASDCGLGLKATNRAVSELVEAGLIVMEAGRLVGPRAGRTCRYRLVNVVEGNTLEGPQRSRIDNVVEKGTLSKRIRQRSRNDNVNVVESTTEPDQETRPRNQTKKKARPLPSDPWQLAQSAMTGDILRTDAFRVAWLAWVEYRRQARKPLTTATIRLQLPKLEKYGHDGAIASINRSIEAGWQGLFEPDTQRPQPTQPLGRIAAPPGKYDRFERKNRPAPTPGARPGPTAPGTPAAT